MSTTSPLIPAVATPESVIDPVIQQKVDLLESTFDTIYRERMQDIPVINDKIYIKAVGLQKWQKSYLGIMITPWFMNLILLPGDGENWDELQEQRKKSYSFPSGRYTFIIGFEPAIGKYLMCSLFSPMFDFADNDAAVETAEIAIIELLNSENVEQIDLESQQIEDIWNGRVEKPEDSAEDAIEQLSESQKQTLTDQPTLDEKMQKPISRRELLRGALMRDNDED